MSDQLESALYHWYWGDSLDDIEGYIRYRYGRGIFLSETDEGTCVVGNTLPENTNDETGENTLKFHNIGFYESPIFRGHGKVVIRLPPSREMIYQLYREERGRSDEWPTLTVDDEVTYS